MRQPAVVMEEDDGNVFDKDLQFGCLIDELFKLDVPFSVIINHNPFFQVFILENQIISSEF